MLERLCSICGDAYSPTGKNQKYCRSAACLSVVHSRANAKQRAKRGSPVGAGKGGSNKRFTEHGQYSTGQGNFIRLRRHLRETIKNCNRCGKDLADATRFEWCVHHRDHDRTHNVLENMEMLCKRCHQLEHKCRDNLSH